MNGQCDAGVDVTSAGQIALEWGDWVPFTSSNFRAIPAGPGLYRVRANGQEPLMYIGQTGRSLRGRLQSLRLHALAAEMPFNDPHTAAPSLWAWRREQAWNFECSAAPFLQGDRARLGAESWLLWQHRLRHGASTLCNHGRFHGRYSKSGDRRTGRRGGVLPEGLANPAGGPSSEPLRLTGSPQGGNWMGMAWSPWSPLNPNHSYAGPALYRIASKEESGLLYIGETRNLRQRLRNHARRPWSAIADASFVQMPGDTEKYVLHELENDLIGAHVEQCGSAPTYQFVDGRDAGKTV